MSIHICVRTHIHIRILIPIHIHTHLCIRNSSLSIHINNLYIQGVFGTPGLPCNRNALKTEGGAFDPDQIRGCRAAGFLGFWDLLVDLGLGFGVSV